MIKKWGIMSGLIIGIVAAYAQVDSSPVAIMQSTFDTDADGWTATFDSTGASWQASGGNPGGYIQASDTGQGQVWYWNAPAKFLGNQSAADGLTFDLWQTPTTTQFNSPDVVLVGGGITLQFNTSYNPGSTWTSYAVLLSPTAGWWNQAADAPATQADMETVLSSLTNLQIRGEYSGDLDTDGLDNVILSSIPGFEDVPDSYWAHDFIYTIYLAGITGGCSANPPLFCPNNIITRGQMAVFMEVSLGVAAAPPCIGTVFSDVNAATVGSAFCGFIEDFAARGITGGCGGGNYCPNSPVTRWQMAVFIEAALGRVPGQLPPACSGTFTDVNASTVGDYVCRIIEDFAVQGITGGCGGGNFCPFALVTRAQMAVFLVAAPPPLNP